jgi:hypothetical protein
MLRRNLSHQIGIFSALLLALVAVIAAGAVQSPLSAQAPIASPVDQVSPATHEAPPLLHPLDGDYVNGIDYGRQSQPQQVNGNCGPDPDCASVGKVLPNEKGLVPNIPNANGAAACPIDSQRDSMSRWYVVRGDWYFYPYDVSLFGASTWELPSIAHPREYANFDFQTTIGHYGYGLTGIIVRGSPLPLTAGDWSSGYTFNYNLGGYYLVWKNVAGSTYLLQDWAYSPAISEVIGGDGRAWNTVRIVAFGPQLSFYINGTLLWTGIDESLHSGQVGIMRRKDSSGTSYGGLDMTWARLCEFPTIYLPQVMRQ